MPCRPIAASGGTLDAYNLLKPPLSSGQLRCIGATTYTEFRGVFEKDHALSRRFQKIDALKTPVKVRECARFAPRRGGVGGYRGGMSHLHLPALLLPLRGWARRGAAACRDRQALGLLGVAAIMAAILPGLPGLVALCGVAAVAVSWLAAQEVKSMIDSIAMYLLPVLRVAVAAGRTPASHCYAPPLRPPRLPAP